MFSSVSIFLFKYLSVAASMAKAAFASLLAIVTANPVAAAVAVAFVVSNVITYRYTSSSVEERVKAEDAVVISKLTEDIKAYNLDREALNQKVVSLEEKSRRWSEEVQSFTEKKKAELKTISSEYEAKLAAAVKTTPKENIFTLKLPPTGDSANTTTIRFQVDDGKVVCRQFPKIFLLTINDMVDAANEPLQLSMSPPNLELLSTNHLGD